MLGKEIEVKEMIGIEGMIVEIDELGKVKENEGGIEEMEGIENEVSKEKDEIDEVGKKKKEVKKGYEIG